MSANLLELFRERTAAHRDDLFLQAPGGHDFTFGEIDDLAARFATLIRERGVEPGDRVVVQVDKSPAAVALYLACLQVGAIYVPLNTAYTSDEVGYFLGDAEPRLFVCRPDDRVLMSEVAETCGVPELATLGADREADDSDLWAESIDAPPEPEICPRDGDDLAAFLYTSGTTGRSKGAMLSHANLASNALTLHDYWQFQPGDVLLHALPIFHIHGLFVALHCALLNASRTIFLPGPDPQALVAGLHDGATVMMGVPTFYTRLLAHDAFGADDCRNVRLFISGSAPMTEPVHQAWTARTGHRILERYGMTEAGMICSNPVDGERIPGTVGFPLPGVEVRITDDAGNEIARGETGNIEVRGPNVFRGYWRMPEKTAQEFRDDGFFITGDLGTMDGEGRVSIVGRAKDLIISGGYNVYPKEIELLIDELDGVGESAVIGVPHADFGEGVVAVVVAASGATPDETAILGGLQDKLARFKQPKRVFFVDELPRNAMGKVQKAALRDRFAQTFD